MTRFHCFAVLYLLAIACVYAWSVYVAITC